MEYEKLIDLKNEKREYLRSLILRCKDEKRHLTETEDEEFNQIKENIRSIEQELINIEKNNNKPIKTIKQMENQISIVNLINQDLNKRNYSESSTALIKAGDEIMKRGGQSYEGIAIPMNYRAAITASAEGEAIQTDVLDLITPLRDKLVLTQAGAQMLTGLVGNVTLPKYSGSSALWKGETDTAGDGAGAFSDIELTPKRLTTSIELSKQFLMQNCVDAENMLRSDIINAIVEKLQKTILSDGKGVSGVPDGLFANCTTFAGDPTWASVLGMEEEIEEGNALQGNLTYIVAPSVKTKFKATAKVAGSANFIQEGNEVNGYPVLSTNSIMADGAVLGNFNDIVIAQWGAMDIVVDPYSQAKAAKVVLVINAYFDVVARNAKSFSVRKFATGA